jgi:hypothetical protein
MCMCAGMGYMTIDSSQLRRKHDSITAFAAIAPCSIDRGFENSTSPYGFILLSIDIICSDSQEKSFIERNSYTISPTLHSLWKCSISFVLPNPENNHQTISCGRCMLASALSSTRASVTESSTCNIPKSSVPKTRLRSRKWCIKVAFLNQI